MRPTAVRVAVAFSLSLPLAVCWAQGDPVLTNGGFEELEGGQPVDWEILGRGEITDDARTGEHALRLVREADAETAETGLNRAWSPESGARGAMLGEVEGAVTFWYRVPHADEDAQIRFNIIPMTDEPLENQGARRAYLEIPPGHVGDGQWHLGAVAYDYREHEGVRWVQVSPRITGGAAEWILDDIEWTDSLGPFLALDQTEIFANRRILRARISNLGDAVLSGPAVELDLPAGLDAVALDADPLPAALGAGERAFRHWRLEGPATDGDEIIITVTAAGSPSPVESTVTLESNVIAYSLMADPPVIEPEGEATITLAAKNYGPADSPPLVLEVELPEALELVGELPGPEPVPQGGWAPHRFRVRAVEPAPGAAISAKVSLPDGTTTVGTSVVVAEDPGPGASTLSTGDVRLVLPRSPWGPGPVRVEVRGGDGWSVAGWMPHLGRVVTIGADGADEVVLFAGEPEATRRGIGIRSEATDSTGATWESDVELSVTGTRGMVALSYQVRCDEDRPVRAFEGPAVLSTEYGDEALFPGLEWVQGDEETSSSLDLELGNEDRLRFVPDGYDITVPLMAVREGGTLTALLWDMRQRWDSVRDKPAAYFSRPGYLAGYEDATMGLLAPAVGEGWLEEDSLRAEQPYELSAGRVLQLGAYLWVTTDATSVLDAVDQWIALYGLPAPNEPPRGDWVSEVEFSARALMESLYDEEEGDWWHSKGAGSVLSPKIPASPHFAWDLRRAARITDDRAKAETYNEWADRMTDILGIPAQGFDGGLEYSTGEGWLTGLAESAYRARSTQREDGSWGYQAERKGEGVFIDTDYWELGDQGESELGTNARRAVELLQFARVTGHEESYEAGVRALEYMERFTVPRAGQVWEVPVHVPDIIAAADAIEAYLEAYQIDGDGRWLDRAVYWARAGVPFIYLWGEADRPYLKYASIAVFGGTFYVWSWIGRPVQWNGLNYAYSLRRLAEFDSTHDWPRIAEGILVSALHQQEPSGEDVALWPDSIGARDREKSSWIFAPWKIYQHLYMQMGLAGSPRTRLIGEGEDRVHVSLMGHVVGGALGGDGTLDLTVALPPDGRSSVLIGPVSPPEAVAVDGQAMDRGPAQEGWTYLAARRMVSVPVVGGGEHSISLAGVEVVEPLDRPETRFELAFEFEDSTEGWIPERSVGLLRSEGGTLTFEVTDVDPYVVRPNLSVPTHLGDELVLTMSVDRPGEAQLYWGTEAEPFFSEDRVIRFTPNADGELHEYRFPVGLHPAWPGQTIVSFRIDPTGGGPATVRVERLVLEPGG